MIYARINAKEYDGDIVIERVYRDGNSSVPAWDECGMPDLCGDTSVTTTMPDGSEWPIGNRWSTVQAAARALAAEAKIEPIRILLAIV